MASVTKVVGAVSEVAYKATDLAWTNASNVTTEDSNAATVTAASNLNIKYLKCTMTGNVFAIPAGASIDGIEVSYSADTDGGTGSVFFLDNVQLVVGDDITGLDLYDNTIATGPTQETKTVGSSTENWGVTLTPNAVNASDFGVAIRFQRNGATSRGLRVYWVKITVHYTEGAGRELNSIADAAICFGSVPADSDSISSFKFKFPGLGSVKAALFMSVKSNGNQMTDGSDSLVAIDGLDYYYGMAASTSMYSCTSLSADGAFAVARANVSTMVSEVISEKLVTVSAMGTDSVTVAWSGAANQPINNICCVAFGGSGVQAALVTQDGLNGSTGETSDITSIGFEPDLLIALSGLEAVDSGGHDVYGGLNFGLVHNGTSVGHAHAHVSQRYKVSSAGGDLTDLANTVRVGDDLFHFNVNWGDIGGDGEEYSWTAGSFDASGLTVTASGDNGTGEDGSGILALKFPATTKLAIGNFATPTSTGSQSPTFDSFSFTPRFMLLAATLATNTETRTNDTANGDSFSLIAIRDEIQASVGLTNQNGQNPVNNLMFYQRDSLRLLNGDQTENFDATFTQFDSGGLTANFSAADGTARQGAFLAFLSPAPTITDVSPATAALNSTGQTITLTGTGFIDGATATITAIGKTAHTVNTVTVNSSTDTDLDVDFDGDAGTYTITLTNPDGQSATDTILVTSGKPPIGSSGTALGGGSFKISMGISL